MPPPEQTYFHEIRTLTVKALRDEIKRLLQAETLLRTRLKAHEDALSRETRGERTAAFVAYGGAAILLASLIALPVAPFAIFLTGASGVFSVLGLSQQFDKEIEIGLLQNETVSLKDAHAKLKEKLDIAEAELDRRLRDITAPDS